MAKELPACIEAEESVLAACMLSQEVAGRVIPQLQVEDFLRPRHQTIFIVMKTLVAKGAPCDPVSIWDVLQARHSKVSRMDVLNIHDNSFALAVWEHHLRIVKRCSLQRRLVRILTELLSMAQDPQEDIEDVLGYVQSALRQIEQEAAGRPRQPQG